MKAAELRAISTPDLEKRVLELKTELFNLRFQLAVGQLENTANISKVKRQLHKLKQSLAKEKMYKED